MTQLMQWDQDLFLWINSFHTAWLDPFIFLITKSLIWLPLYIYLAYLIFSKYGQEGWLVLAGVALAILFSDQITSTWMKPYFARLRPSHEPSLHHLIHTVNGYEGGLYGFASGHAANTMATAFFVWLVLRKIYPWIGLILVWSGLMMYTRIYLGVHYPGDILVGMLVGLLGGWIGYRFYRWLKRLRANRV